MIKSLLKYRQPDRIKLPVNYKERYWVTAYRSTSITQSEPQIILKTILNNNTVFRVFSCINSDI